MNQDPILIALCGNTFPDIRKRRGNFDLWFKNRIEEAGAEVVVWDAMSGTDPSVYSFSGCVITGSPSMVTDREDWSVALGKRLLKWIEADKPLLGVCYGHQLLADVLGGRVADQLGGREIGSLPIYLAKEAEFDLLFSTAPVTFKAQLTHAQSVTALPEGAVRLAYNNRVANQAFRWGDKVWGVQFHPEFSASVMRDYLTCFREQTAPESRSDLEGGVEDCPYSTEVLTRFVNYCRQR